MYPLPESTMYVVTFSGVTSGGMVTSGTICWTCKERISVPGELTSMGATHMGYKGLLYERSHDSALPNAV